jgi:hypothetical protein
MMTSTSKHRPIEFSGTIQELAQTLGMAVEEVTCPCRKLNLAGN